MLVKLRPHVWNIFMIWCWGKAENFASVSSFAVGSYAVSHRLFCLTFQWGLTNINVGSYWRKQRKMRTYVQSARWFLVRSTKSFWYPRFSYGIKLYFFRWGLTDNNVGSYWRKQRKMRTYVQSARWFWVHSTKSFWYPRFSYDIKLYLFNP